ncbi:MAG TPA: RNA methyltransferase [Balneolaceae bacterium]|nr:RNA methyltransferase [Balneolaceae bacterium]
MELRQISNRQLTLLRKLNRKKYRQKERLFLLEGARAVQQVLKNDLLKVEALFFDDGKGYWNHTEWQGFIKTIDSFQIANDAFLDVTDTDHPQGVLALCAMPEESPLEKLTAQSRVMIALDAIQDPGNVGTIIRTASWFGAGGILAGKGTVDLFHSKVVRSTAGATGSVPYLNGDLNEMLREFEQAGWKVFLLDAGTQSISLSQVKSIDKAIIVVGNEAHGLSPEIVTAGRQKVKISSPENNRDVESLNAAVATSIALYDLTEKL